MRIFSFSKYTWNDLTTFESLIFIYKSAKHFYVFFNYINILLILFVYITLYEFDIKLFQIRKKNSNTLKKPLFNIYCRIIRSIITNGIFSFSKYADCGLNNSYEPNNMTKHKNE